VGGSIIRTIEAVKEVRESETLAPRSQSPRLRYDIQAGFALAHGQRFLLAASLLPCWRSVRAEQPRRSTGAKRNPLEAFQLGVRGSLVRQHRVDLPAARRATCSRVPVARSADAARGRRYIDAMADFLAGWFSERIDVRDGTPPAHLKTQATPPGKGEVATRDYASAGIRSWLVLNDQLFPEHPVNSLFQVKPLRTVDADLNSASDDVGFFAVFNVRVA
jgi:hypothetical protein